MNRYKKYVKFNLGVVAPGMTDTEFVQFLQLSTLFSERNLHLTFLAEFVRIVID